LNIKETIDINFKRQNKALALLVDPDKAEEKYIASVFLDKEIKIDLVLIGGSILINGSLEKTLQLLKKYTEVPLILFPGNHAQISSLADGILLLSLISGRNPEYLIGQHVQSAFALAASGIEIMPTGYILLDSGSTTTVQYISNTMPIPSNKPELAAATALAGTQLGLQYIYLEAGSGAQNNVNIDTISLVRKTINVPLIVGGGIDSVQKALDSIKAGADIIVVGTAAERNYEILKDISIAIQSANKC
jgi:phosphoglycerol geranylgeranyltransferase